MNAARSLPLLVLLVLAGCGGGDGPGPNRPEPDEQRGAVVRDSVLGYELRVPEGWKVPDDRRPGAEVPVGGEGAGCVIGSAGALPDVSTREKLLAFARETALKRAAGGRVVVQAVRGANVDGAEVRVLRAESEARSAIFASAGGAVALTCATRIDDAKRFERGLPELYASVKLPRDSALDALQPRIAALPDVTGVMLRRLPRGVAVQMRLGSFRSAQRVATMALRLAGAELDGAVGVSAADPDSPNRLVAARVKSGADEGFVQVIPDRPVTISVPR